MTQDLMSNEQKKFAEKLIEWYLVHKRDLPWRSTKDPYVIWLSEIILQQTRVKQGLPYFNKFLEKYPNVEAFAAAPEKEIMKLWQGLGYYSRARNMMICAQTVVQNYGGKFPETYKELQKLKGIGKYTAAAIASFSFKECVPVIDGNVYRVLARLFGFEQDISQSTAFAFYFKENAALISKKKPDLYNQAIMEFGALQCVPRSPDCFSCIFEAQCFANVQGTQQDFPVKTKKIKKKHRYFYYFLIQHEDELLIRYRSGNDIWNGLYDFYGLESDEEKDFDDMIDKEFGAFLKEGTLSVFPSNLKHILTHQVIYAKFFLLEVGNENLFETIKEKFGLLKTSLSELDSFPRPILIEKFLKSDFL